MQLFFHVIVGLLLGSATSFYTGVAVEPQILAAAALGSVFPDLDMVFIHRKTLHFPAMFSFAAVLTGITALYTNSYPLYLLCYFLLGSAVHSLIDIFGGGKEMRPWQEKDDRAVYDHVRKKWIAPRRLYYDGSKPSFALGLLISLPLLVFSSDNVKLFTALLLGLSTVYMVLRRKLVSLLPTKYDRWSQFIKYHLFGGELENID